MKNSFLSNISHEIRTPVNVIVGFSNLLSDPSYGAEQKKFFINEINHNSKELLKIIDGIIYSAKINAEEIVPEMEFHSIGEIINQLETGVGNFLRDSKIKHVKVIRKKVFIDNDQKIFTDPKKLAEAILHLLDASIKFSRSNSINYSLQTDKKNMIFLLQEKRTNTNHKKLKDTISKRLIGDNCIAMNHNEHSFDYEIADRLIKALGGKLKMISTFDEGSSFYFTIPLLVEKPV